MRLDHGLTAAGTTVHARAEGVLYNDIGRIVVSPASLHGVDERLWDCLRIAVDQLHLVIRLHPTDDGRAVEIDQIGPEARVWYPATRDNPDALRLAEYLRGHGFQAGEEGASPTLLLGPPQTSLNPTPTAHERYLRVSLPRRSPPRSAASRHDPDGLTALDGWTAMPGDDPPDRGELAPLDAGRAPAGGEAPAAGGG